MATIIGPNAVSPSSVRDQRPGSEVQSFINFLGNPSTQIPLDSNFLVVFDNMPPAITNPFPDFENSWNVDNTKNTLVQLFNNTNDTPLHGYGTMFVQAFEVPGESVVTERVNTVLGGPSLGLLSGVVAKDRAQYGATFDIAILETNKSFTDFVIRPWITLVGHYGLLTRSPESPQNVRTNITGYLFDKNDGNAVRKIYKYTGCAPVNVGTIQYGYGSNERRLDKVSFVFNKFSVQDAPTGQPNVNSSSSFRQGPSSILPTLNGLRSLSTSRLGPSNILPSLRNLTRR